MKDLTIENVYLNGFKEAFNLLGVTTKKSKNGIIIEDNEATVDVKDFLKGVIDKIDFSTLQIVGNVTKCIYCGTPIRISGDKITNTFNILLNSISEHEGMISYLKYDGNKITCTFNEMIPENYITYGIKRTEYLLYYMKELIKKDVIEFVTGDRELKFNSISKNGYKYVNNLPTLQVLHLNSIDTPLRVIDKDSKPYLIKGSRVGISITNEDEIHSNYKKLVYTKLDRISFAHRGFNQLTVVTEDGCVRTIESMNDIFIKFEFNNTIVYYSNDLSNKYTVNRVKDTSKKRPLISDKFEITKLTKRFLRDMPSIYRDLYLFNLHGGEYNTIEGISHKK